MLLSHDLGSCTLLQNGITRSSGCKDRMKSWSRKAGAAASLCGLKVMAPQRHALSLCWAAGGCAALEAQQSKRCQKEPDRGWEWPLLHPVRA